MMAGKEWKYPKDYRKNDQRQTRNRSSYQSASSMNSFPSPYNFVPLSKKVFFPDSDWADRISHDIPFSDGICGVIDISVEAVTPIYVRSGGVHPEKPEDRLNDPKTQDFFSVNEGGQYAIPGTSFKGMLRNVVEIASFGKMSRVDDHRYGVRDLTRGGEFYRLKMTDGDRQSGYRSKVKSGWLVEVQEESGNNAASYYIIPCSVARVEQELLENYAGGTINLGVVDRVKDKKHAASSIRKYKLWADSGKQLEISFELDDSQPTKHLHTCGNLVYRKVTALGQGDQEGKIVFSGQPSDRKRKGCTDKYGKPCSRGKHMEFVFYSTSSERVRVEKSLMHDFEFIHSEQSSAHGKPQPNEEWAYWKKHLESGERVPVFYLEDNTGKLESMGLAMMFRLPYKNTIHDAIRQTSPDHLDQHRFDMAEAVFGRVSDQDGLRGRCTVTALMANGSPQAGEVVTKVLNAPKPTFYPNYIEQPQARADGTITGDYVTLMDEGSKLRGWKRYPTRRSGLGTAMPDPDQRKVSTSFRPLPPGTVFRGKIHVHNLRPSELGAIVWALSFGGRENCFHSLGMAKPYGYGVVKVSIIGSQMTGNDGSSTDIGSAMDAFIKLMEAEVGEGKGWASSTQIKSLLAMADPSKAEPATLRYPVLDRSRNDFAEIKKAKKVLKPVHST